MGVRPGRIRGRGNDGSLYATGSVKKNKNGDGIGIGIAKEDKKKLR